MINDYLGVAVRYKWGWGEPRNSPPFVVDMLYWGGSYSIALKSPIDVVLLLILFVILET